MVLTQLFISFEFTILHRNLFADYKASTTLAVWESTMQRSCWIFRGFYQEFKFLMRQTQTKNLSIIAINHFRDPRQIIARKKKREKWQLYIVEASNINLLLKWLDVDICRYYENIKNNDSLVSKNIQIESKDFSFE